MSKYRTSSCIVRDNKEGYPNIVHHYDGTVSYGYWPPINGTVTWVDNIYDSVPMRPNYSQVLRSAFQWKAKYGTPEAREQHLVALERRATLAHNRVLRDKYLHELNAYKNAVNRYGTYNPMTGVTTVGTSPIFRYCANVQTKHKVASTGSTIAVGNHSWWSTQGYTEYVTFDGPVSLDSPWLYRDEKDLVRFPGAFQSSGVNATLVAGAISKAILNDTRLMNINGGPFSILTFLAELSDLKHLPSLLKKWTRSSHDISDKYLGVSFGVLPFYSDICAILDRLNNLPYAIDEWNRQADAAQVRSYHCTIDPNKVGAQYKGPIELRDDCVRQRLSYYERPVNHYGNTILTQEVTIRGHVYLLPRRIDEAKISALKAHIWGTNSILGTVWEKIPFSFVVDWFLHLGPLIQAFEEVDDLLTYQIIDAGYSVKVVSKWKTIHGSLPGLSDLFACDSTNTNYKRVPLSPKVFGRPLDEPYNITGLNVSQGILSAALVHQQLKR